MSAGYIGRSEVELWNNVSGQASQVPIFGDYGIVNPEYIDLDPRIISNQMTPAIRYALEKEWYVVRGESFRKGGYEQYYGLARAILNSGHYFGAGFSFGDHYINEKAHNNDGSGNPMTWLTAGLNHHIMVTLQGLF